VLLGAFRHARDGAGGELIEVRAFSLLMADNQQLRRAVLELAEVLAPRV